MRQSAPNRWSIVAGGMICQFCAGMLYSWSLYVKPLVSTYDWPQSSVTITFSLATFIIPIVMIFAGRLLPRIGPTKTALIGAVSLTAGLVLSGFARSLPLLYLGYGVLGGIGVGFIYGVPIATCVKWFPDKKGLISGLSVAGFGLGSIVFAPICTALLSAIGPSSTFLVQGGITLVGMLVGAPMMKAAPDGYAPPGWTPPAQTAGAKPRDFTSLQMVRCRQYWFLLIMYLFANVAGLFIIGHASPVSQEVARLTATQAGVIVSVLSIANTCGRFLGGAASDRLGAARVVTILYIADAILLLTLPIMGQFFLIALGIGGLAVCFGGMMGAYPSIVLDYFGPTHYSTNYALVFLAFGFGGLVANQIASTSLAVRGSYTLAFMVIGGMCVIGVVMSLLSRPPEASKPVK